jgi:hypothetical protein
VRLRQGHSALGLKMCNHEFMLLCLI